MAVRAEGSGKIRMHESRAQGRHLRVGRQDVVCMFGADGRSMGAGWNGAG